MADYSVGKCKNKTCIYVFACEKNFRLVSIVFLIATNFWMLSVRREVNCWFGRFSRASRIIVWIASSLWEEFLQEICTHDSYTTIRFTVLTCPPASTSFCARSIQIFVSRWDKCVPENLSPGEIDTLLLTLSARKYMLRLKRQVSKLLLTQTNLYVETIRGSLLYKHLSSLVDFYRCIKNAFLSLVMYLIINESTL